MFHVLPISFVAFMPVAPATICDRDHEMTGFFPRAGRSRAENWWNPADGSCRALEGGGTPAQPRIAAASNRSDRGALIYCCLPYQGMPALKRSRASRGGRSNGQRPIPCRLRGHRIAPLRSPRIASLWEAEPFDPPHSRAVAAAPARRRHGYAVGPLRRGVLL